MNWRVLTECVSDMLREDEEPLSRLLEFTIFDPIVRRKATKTMNGLFDRNMADIQGEVYEDPSNDFSKCDGVIPDGPWSGMTYKLLSTPGSVTDSYEFELVDAKGQDGEIFTTNTDLLIWWISKNRMIVAETEALRRMFRILMKRLGLDDLPMGTLVQLADDEQTPPQLNSPYKKANGSLCIRVSIETLASRCSLNNRRELFGNGNPNHVPLEDKLRKIGDLDGAKMQPSNPNDPQFDRLLSRKFEKKQDDFMSRQFNPLGPTVAKYIEMLENGSFITSHWFDAHIKTPDHIQRVQDILTYRGFGNVVEICKEATIKDKTLGPYWAIYTDTSIMILVKPNGVLFNVMAETPKKVSDTLGLGLSTGESVAPKDVISSFSGDRFRFPGRTKSRLKSLLADRYEDIINHPNDIKPGNHTTPPRYRSKQFPKERPLDQRRAEIPVIRAQQKRDAERRLAVEIEKWRREAAERANAK